MTLKSMQRIKAIRVMDYENAIIMAIGIFLAVVLRFSLGSFKSGDYNNYTSGWYTIIKAQGFAAFGTNFSNYTPLYLYLLYAVSLLFPHLTDVVAIKLSSIVFDFVCAWYVYRLVRLKYGAGLLPLLACFAILFAPTVVLNSALWGQADSIYTTALVASTYYLVTKRETPALLAFGFAFALKIQAVFLVPLLLALLLKRQIAWKSLLLVPLVYLGTVLPAWFAGRPLRELLSIYISQADVYHDLTKNAPNIYTWMPNDQYNFLYPAGLICAGVVGFLFVVGTYKSRTRLTHSLVIQLAFTSVLLIPYFMPKMHDRYFFPADVFAIIFAFYFPRYFWVPLVVGLSSFFTYLIFLWGQHVIPLPMLALALLVTIILVVRQVVKTLYGDTDAEEGAVSAALLATPVPVQPVNVLQLDHHVGIAMANASLAEPVPGAGRVRAQLGAHAQRYWRTALANGLGEALWLFVALRIGLSLFALLASLLFELPGPCSWDEQPALHTTGLDFRLLGVWQRWDACWYGKIATVGYQPGDGAVAFFPLYPALMRFVGLALAGNFVLSGLVVSGVAYIVAMVGLYRLVRHDFDEHIAQRTVLYISIFPTAFFLFAPFTESLFLALAVWTLYGARRAAWGQTAITGLFTGLARLQGGVLGLPLAWEFIRQWRNRRAAGEKRVRLGDLSMIAVSLLPALGFSLFIFYSYLVTGWSAFQAQQSWGHTYRTPWAAIAISWEHIRTHGDVIEGLNLTSLLLFIALLVWGVRRIPLSYTLYAAPQLLLFVSRQTFFSPLMSTSRYLLGVFPVFVLLALLGRNRRLHNAWLVISLLLLGLLFYAYLQGVFVA